MLANDAFLFVLSGLLATDEATSVCVAAGALVQ